MSNAVHAFGTLLKLGDGGSPEVFTTIAEVNSITGPGYTADVIDVTNHSSTGAFREHMASLLDAGELTFDVNFIPTDPTHDQTSGLFYKYLNRIKTNLKLVFPDGASTTWSFAGYVTSFSTSEPIDNRLTAAVTIKITGAPTFS